jgi:hypothetical protein
MDSVEIRADGQRHLVRGPSSFRLKAKGHREEAKKILAERHEEKMRKVRFKKSIQKKNGWPTDKSAV